MPETKLENARRRGDLTAAIGALREEARAGSANAGAPAREQLDIVDGSLRLAEHLTAQGKTGRRTTASAEWRSGWQVCTTPS